jgi:hypothetical protein
MDPTTITAIATVTTAIATCIAGIAARITAIILAAQTGAFKAAAKANALAARIEYYYTQVESSPEQRKLKDQQVHLVYQLDEVLDELKIGTARTATLSPHNVRVPLWEYKTGDQILREQSQH